MGTGREGGREGRKDGGRVSLVCGQWSVPYVPNGQSGGREGRREC